jgi:hypothetical protein
LFPPGFWTESLYVFIFSPIRTTCPAHLVILYLITRVLGERKKSWRSSLCSLLQSRYLVPLRPKYLPRHPIVKHPQSLVLPQCERPSFRPAQNNT